MKNDRISGITVSGTRTTTRPPSPKTVLRSVSESTLEESTKIHTKDSIYRTGSIGIDRRINSFSDLDVIEGLLFAIRNNSRSSYSYIFARFDQSLENICENFLSLFRSRKEEFTRNIYA